MKMIALFLCLVFLLSGCALTKLTAVKINANAKDAKGVIPAGMPVPAEVGDANGDVWFIRFFSCSIGCKPIPMSGAYSTEAGIIKVTNKKGM